MRTDTRARSFPTEVKIKIAERDSVQGWPCCIRCGRPAPGRLAFSNAHYISRAQGGLGIPENGLTLCPACHQRYDQSEHREGDRAFYRDYLQSHYEGWDESKLIYRRNKDA